MAREIKTIQWNIGGAKLLKDGSNPRLLSSYSEDGLERIIDFIGEQDPDIVTLQETHECNELSQPQVIAEALSYEWANDAWNDSHIEIGQKLGQAVLSKLHIKEHWTELFINPLWQADWETGALATSHDKGLSTSDLALDDTNLRVQNLHLIPFRRFGIDPAGEGTDVIRDVQLKIGDYEGPRIIQGDFNIDSSSLSTYFPDLFIGGISEVEQQEPTVPSGRRLDHILYSGMTVVKSTVIKHDILTDHYPLVTVFEV
jgi:endonuclease/exonuclease/phosphatase family metal-dependent hydrolase